MAEIETVFLYTETTGLSSRLCGGKDEVLQIALVDDFGETLVDSLVKPSYKRHGVTRWNVVTPEISIGKE